MIDSSVVRHGLRPRWPIRFGAGDGGRSASVAARTTTVTIATSPAANATHRSCWRSTPLAETLAAAQPDPTPAATPSTHPFEPAPIKARHRPRGSFLEPKRRLILVSEILNPFTRRMGCSTTPACKRACGCWTPAPEPETSPSWPPSWSAQAAASADALRLLADRLGPGGIVAFQEFNFTPESLRPSPPTPLWQESWGWIVGTIRSAGIPAVVGSGLRRAFLDAGLPEPELRLESVVAGGPESLGYEWMAETVRSMLPLIVKSGVASAEEVGIDTLASRLRAGTTAAGGVVKAPDMVSAWTHRR